jgi:geranylgeranyl reductase family protein
MAAARYDAIVVGAGPAGSSAALALARRGRNVLIVERERFPREKACGDAVPAGAIERLHALGLADRLGAARFYPLSSVRLVSPSAYELVERLPVRVSGARDCVVPRHAFDELLLQAAVSAGADHTIGHVTDPLVEQGVVRGVRVRGGAEMRAHVVIGADGAGSAIARALLPVRRRDEHQAVAIRGYVDGFDVRAHEAEFFLLNDVLPGYAWVFPIGDGVANVGIGMRLDAYKRQRRTLGELLERFCGLPELRRRARHARAVRDVAAWPLRFASKWHPLAFHGALLTGDAAGLINPLTGGGIHNAILSGCIAAEVVDEAIEREDVSCGALLAHERRCRAQLFARTHAAHLVQKHVLPRAGLVDGLVRARRRYAGAPELVVPQMHRS